MGGKSSKLRGASSSKKSGTKEETTTPREQPRDVTAGQAPLMGFSEQADPGQVLLRDGSGSTRKVSVHRRRRAAIASEKSEQLASARWQSAFEALRRKEEKGKDQLAVIVNVLEQHPVFNSMATKVLDEIALSMRTSHVHSGSSVITQGEGGDAFYVVGDGTLAAFVVDKKGNESKVHDYAAGDSFGELALMYDCPRAASVRVTSANGALVYKLGRIAFRNLVSSAMSKANAGLEERLGSVPVLSGLDKSHLVQLTQALEQVEFAAGEYICEMGQDADSLYLVLQGEVACHQGGENELRLAEGSFFGEACLSHAANPHRQANVVAVGAVRAARLKATDCSAILGDLQQALDRAFCKKVLHSIRLFDNLSPRELSSVLSELTITKVPAGFRVIEQGGKNDAFYIIKLGSVDVMSAVQEREPVKLHTLIGGDYFGERSLLTDEPPVASIVATEETELMALSRPAFEKLIGPMHAIIDREVAKRDAERLRVAGGRVKWEELHLTQILGEGSFGCVRLATHKTTKEQFALKGLHKGHLISTNQVDNVINEKTIMKECHHPFILTCIDSFDSRTHVYLLLQLALGGELFTYLSKVRRLKQPAASLYASMVACALGFLSSRKIAHRDLKLENLLFDKDGYLKLVDFGFAKHIDGSTHTFCGTPDYLAPEILAHKGHNHAVDWWTLGVLYYEMLHGEPPFAANDQMDTFKKIAEGKYRCGSHVSKESADLIAKLLSQNPATRLGVLAGGEHDVLNHPVMAYVDVKKLEAKEIKVPFVPKDDFSAFDDYGDTSEQDANAKKYERYLDAQYDEQWRTEFA